MVPSTPVSTRPVRFFPSRVGCWRAAARSGFTPRGAGNPGRHQLRLLSATRAGPGHAPVRTSCGRPRARSAARPPGDGILVPASFRCRLAANPCARALSPGFTPGQNFLRWRLLEPAARKLYVNWDEATEIAVSGLREVAGSDMGDPRLRALIDELTAASQRFRELWARADVGYRKSIIHMRHPQVGDLHLHRNRLVVPHSGGQHLLIYYAEPGSESAKAPEVLRGLAVTVTAEVEEELTRAPR